MFKAVQLQVQDQWTRWLNYIQQNIFLGHYKDNAG